MKTVIAFLVLIACGISFDAGASEIERVDAIDVPHSETVESVEVNETSSLVETKEFDGEHEVKAHRSVGADKDGEVIIGISLEFSF